MPYKSERIRIAGTKLDLRRKLSDEQRNAIRILSSTYSQRKLAEMFRCSKRTVQNILNPPRQCKRKKRPTAYWTQKKREYRARKQELFLEGKLLTNKSKRKNES